MGRHVFAWDCSPWSDGRELGPVLGTIRVMQGGVLFHEGYAERIEVEPGGELALRGMVESVRVEPGARAGYNRSGPDQNLAAGEHTALPLKGPAGWGYLREEWANAVHGLHSFLKEARLGQLLERADLDLGEAYQDLPGLVDDPVAVALDTAMRALVNTDTGHDDLRLWALISELMFNPVPELGLPDPEAAGLWCPQTMRRELDMEDILRYEDAPTVVWGVPMTTKPNDVLRLRKAFCDAVWPLCHRLIMLGSGKEYALYRMIYRFLDADGIEPTAIGLRQPRPWVMKHDY